MDWQKIMRFSLISLSLFLHISMRWICAAGILSCGGQYISGVQYSYLGTRVEPLLQHLVPRGCYALQLQQKELQGAMGMFIHRQCLTGCSIHTRGNHNAFLGRVIQRPGGITAVSA